MDPFTWLLVVVLVLVALYKLGTRNFHHFSSRGIKSCSTLPFVGSMASIALRRKATAIVMEDIFKEFPHEPVVGFFVFQDPILVLKDPEIIKRITVKDFDHFVDHRQFISEKADGLLGRALSVLRGEQWHNMRTTLSPVFTSRKMKNMFQFMNECGKQMGDYLQEEINKEESGQTYTLEMKDLFTRYTSDVIATSAFGVHVDSLKEKDNRFYRMGRQVTNFQGIKNLKFLGYTFVPKLMEMLSISFFTKEEKNFFFDLVRQTISAREKDGIIRPDLIHLLMQARKGELKADDDEVESTPATKSKVVNLTEEDIVAQAMIFFFAGFETVSTLLAFSAVVLAAHEDVQQRLQKEIDETLADDSTVTYEKVQGMKYLDMVVSEMLRIYPPAMVTDRVCTKDYVVRSADGEIECVVKKGEAVWIPVYGIHHNPEFFPNPEKFDPDRFSDENKHNIKPYTYLPFGMGPRICIAQRFALLEAKVALIHILSRFNMVVVEKTSVPVTLTKKSFVMAVEGDYWIGVNQRQGF